MKKTFVSIAILSIFSAQAFALEQVQDPSDPANIAAQLQGQLQAQQTNSQAGANANSKGGTGGTGGKSESYNALKQIDNSKFLSLNFPQPAYTQIPGAVDCFRGISVAGSAGWSFISGSKTEQVNDSVCIGIIMANGAHAACQFESEYIISNKVFQLNFSTNEKLPPPPDMRNYSIEECNALKKHMIAQGL